MVNGEFSSTSETRANNQPTAMIDATSRSSIIAPTNNTRHSTPGTYTTAIPTSPIPQAGVNSTHATSNQPKRLDHKPPSRLHAAIRSSIQLLATPTERQSTLLSLAHKGARTTIAPDQPTLADQGIHVGHDEQQQQ